MIPTRPSPEGPTCTREPKYPRILASTDPVSFCKTKNSVSDSSAEALSVEPSQKREGKL
jgi:hypothetical protein